MRETVENVCKKIQELIDSRGLNIADIVCQVRHGHAFEIGEISMVVVFVKPDTTTSALVILLDENIDHNEFVDEFRKIKTEERYYPQD